MVTGQSTGKMGSGPSLPVDWPVVIDTILNFDGHGDGHDAGMCKQTFWDLTCGMQKDMNAKLGLCCD